MKTVDLEHATLDGCVNAAQQDRVVILRDGKPVALVVGVEGMDKEQLELGASEEFWALITERRREGTMSRAELEEDLKRRK